MATSCCVCVQNPCSTAWWPLLLLSNFWYWITNILSGPGLIMLYAVSMVSRWNPECAIPVCVRFWQIPDFRLLWYICTYYSQFTSINNCYDQCIWKNKDLPRTRLTRVRHPRTLLEMCVHTFIYTSIPPSHVNRVLSYLFGKEQSFSTRLLTLVISCHLQIVRDTSMSSPKIWAKQARDYCSNTPEKFMPRGLSCYWLCDLCWTSRVALIRDWW